TALDVDAGQLSRLITRLEGEGLVARSPSPGDARRRLVALTDAGAAAFDLLDRRTIEQVGELLDGLAPHRRARLIAALDDVVAALASAPPATLVRPIRPGDLGWLVSRHG